MIDNEIKDYTHQIFYSTPSYERNKKESIINKNLKQLSHPYYYEYEPLRKICIQILRHEKLKYGNNDNTVYGLLFDGAWLFEEYLNTFLGKENFIHAENRNLKNGIKLLDNAWRVYPDFYKVSNDNNIVLDAKYKRLNYLDSEKIDRNDKHQIVSYAYTLNAKKAGFIYPVEIDNYKKNDCENSYIGNLNSEYNNANCEIHKYALKIPSKKLNGENFNNIKEFIETIESLEKELISKLN